ncbi:MAG: mechanosensitive ion channel family protein [Thomasclavelia sp.]|nr:mechanosensitive ion channel family protein [Thomasclavelia sp.]
MFTKKQLFKNLVRDILFAIIGGCILLGVLYFAENTITISNQEENFDIKLDMAVQKMKNYKQSAKNDQTSYDSFSKAKVDVLAYYYDHTPSLRTNISTMANQWQLQELYIVNSNNEVLFSNTNKPLGNDITTNVKVDNPFTKGNLRYYLSNMNNGLKIIGGRESTDFLAKQVETVSPKKTLKNIKIGINGYIIAIDNKTNEIVYSNSNSAKNIPVSSTDIGDKFLKNGNQGWVTFNGNRYYAQSRKASSDYTFVALAKESDLQNNYNKVISLALMIYAFIAILIVSYIHFIRVESMKRLTDEDNDDEYYDLNKKYVINKDLLRKVKRVLIVGIVFTFGLSYYFQTLSLLSSQEMRSETKLADIEKILDESEAELKDLKQEYNDEYSRRIQNIAVLIQSDTSLANDNDLNEIAKRVQANYIYLFNSSGQVEHTNSTYKGFSLSTDTKDKSSEFWNIIKGYTDIIIQKPEKTENKYDHYVQYIGSKRLDAPGMIEIGVSPQRYENYVQSAKLNAILDNIAVENNGTAFAVDKKTHKFLYFNKDSYIGRDATEYGLSKAALKDEYSGYQTINDTRYFVSSTENGSYYIYVGAPESNIMVGRLEMAVITSIASFSIFVILAFLSLIQRKDKAFVKEEVYDEKPLVQVDINSLGQPTKNVQVVATRWEANTRIPWKEKTPEQKLQTVLGIMITLLGCLLVLYIINGQNSYNPNDILSYILHLKWEKTVSIFSLTYIVMLFIEIYIITAIVRKLITLLCQNLGTKVVTVARLINNFIKYFAVIGALMYSLNFVGVNSSAIIASAGILTLVIGLGAQSLIKDILAGIFIVFEGEFRVGDIITVDNWRGTVLEIGIRATKIQDGSNNIKIINNSLITGVINMTKQRSYVWLDIGIDYGESLERVENILGKELPLLKDKLPSIEDGPYYKGVTELAASSVNIRILAECQEANRIQLTRDLNREIKLIFDKYDINIPYPQVVVNQPKVFKKATKKESEEASKFVNEQKEASKDKHASED